MGDEADWIGGGVGRRLRNDSRESLSPSLEQASQRKKKMSESGVETGVPQEANARQGQMQGGDGGEIR